MLGAQSRLTKFYHDYYYLSTTVIIPIPLRHIHLSGQLVGRPLPSYTVTAGYYALGRACVKELATIVYILELECRSVATSIVSALYVPISQDTSLRPRATGITRGKDLSVSNY